MKRLLILICFVQINFLKSNSKETSKDIMFHPNWKLLNYDKCGLSNADRIIGGKKASIGAYPWLARVGFRFEKLRKNLISFRCGGSVINEYYVLTAAHCFDDSAEAAIVRLGEHNLETNPDCEKSFCNDPYQDYKVVKSIIHKRWDQPHSFHNDIALLRVARPIKFTDFIRPICIVKGKLLTKNYVGQTTEVAGWGVYDIMRNRLSKVLLTVKMLVVNQISCAEAYKNSEVTITSDQVCVGGKIGQDSCGGDSGGPLMKVDEADGKGPRYYMIGIVSFGSKDCGESTMPGVYTKMSVYLPWLLDHMRP